MALVSIVLNERSVWAQLFGQLLAITSLLLLIACIPTGQSLTLKLADVSRTRVFVSGTPVEKTIFGSYLAGRFAEKQQDLVTAARLVGRVVEDDPDNEMLLRKAFALSLGAGDIEKSLVLAQKMADRELADSKALLLLVARDVKSNDFEAARDHLQNIPKQGLATFSRPIAEAWINAGTGKLKAAFKSLEPLSQEKGFSNLAVFHLALLYELSDLSEKALSIYQKALADMGNAPLRMVRAMGSFLERRKKTDEALALYKAYLKSHPSSYLIGYEIERVKKGLAPQRIAIDAVSGFAEGMFNLASALPMNRAGAAALLYARIATYLKPDFPIAQLLIGDILDNGKRYEDAINMYGSVSSKSPFSWLARLKLADNLNNIDRIQDAKTLLEGLAQERLGDVSPLIRLGSLLRLREDFSNAERAYNRAFERIKSDAPNNWSLYYYRGITRERQKKWTEAEQDFLKALELNPDQPHVLNYLGYSWVDQGVNLDRARRMIERAVEQRHEDGYIVDSMGWVLFRLGDYEDAVKHLERAVELRPLDPIISDHLGDAYWCVGRKHEARFQWRRALSLDPEAKEIQAIETKIENGLNSTKKLDSGE